MKAKVISTFLIIFTFIFGACGSTAGAFGDQSLNSSSSSVTLSAGDTITLNCDTGFRFVNLSRNSWTIACRGVSTTVTATSTSVLNTQTSVPPSITPSNTPVVESTITVVATATPTKTQTATPVVSTPTQSSGNTNPYLNAPYCADHDINAWHGLWDYQKGCWYDHTHGDDPSLANSYFGQLGNYWDGSTISYPFNSGVTENSLKHGGYKVSVRTPSYHPYPACGTEDNTDITGDHSDNCVVASRVEYHAVGSLMDLAHRYHSYWMELYICKGHSNQNPSNCGIMRIGGIADYAQLQAPHYNNRVVRPGGTIDFGNGQVMTYAADGNDLPSHSGEPYVFSIPYSASDLESYRNNPPSAPYGQTTNATIDQWSMNDWDCNDGVPAGDPCHNPNARIMFQVGDAFTLVDTQNLNNIHWICYGETNCEYNGSLIGLNEIAVRVLQAWQSGGNGFVTYSGFTDKWGNPTLGCSSVSADCVPFILEHAPVGVAASRSDNGCECQVWEYDYYYNPSNGQVSSLPGKPSSSWRTVGKIKHPN